MHAARQANLLLVIKLGVLHGLFGFRDFTPFVLLNHGTMEREIGQKLYTMHGMVYSLAWASPVTTNWGQRLDTVVLCDQARKSTNLISAFFHRHVILS